MKPAYDLRLGDAFDGLAKMPAQSVDHIVSDPPYSRRTHEGQAETRNDGGKLTELTYEFLTPDQAQTMAYQMRRAARGWVLVMTDHSLAPYWESGFGSGYTFAPLPIVMRGMTVRLQGDGPSSWTVWLIVNRPTGFMDGTKPGAYVGTPGADRAANDVKGAKPLWLMEELVNDYTKPEELICDPFAGSGSTGVAAVRLGRRFLGWEAKPEHHSIAMHRLAGQGALPPAFHNERQGSLLP